MSFTFKQMKENKEIQLIELLTNDLRNNLVFDDCKKVIKIRGEILIIDVYVDIPGKSFLDCAEINFYDNIPSDIINVKSAAERSILYEVGDNLLKYNSTLLKNAVNRVIQKREK